jgi:hypothetical protein
LSPVSAKRGDLKVRTLPPKMVQALAPFAPLFSKRVWQHAQLPSDLRRRFDFCGLPAQGDTIKVPRAFVERLTEAVCCAA